MGGGVSQKKEREFSLKTEKRRGEKTDRKPKGLTIHRRGKDRGELDLRGRSNVSFTKK